jgi:hypothetical protein
MAVVVPSYRGFRYPVEIISHCVWLLLGDGVGRSTGVSVPNGDHRGRAMSPPPPVFPALEADQRGLTPLFTSNMTPYGEVQLRPDRRLDLSAPPPDNGAEGTGEQE